MTTDKILIPEGKTPMDMIYDALRKLDSLEEEKRIAAFKKISLLTEEFLAEHKAVSAAH